MQNKKRKTHVRFQQLVGIIFPVSEKKVELVVSVLHNSTAEVKLEL